MSRVLVLPLLLLASCVATPREREAQTIRTAIDVGRFACGAAAVKRVELTGEQRAWCEGKAP